MKTKVDYLLIDISNSFTKFASSTRKRVGRPSQIPTPRLTESGLRKIFSACDVGTIVVSSVVPTQNALVRRAAGRTPVFFLSAKSRLGVGVKYPKPETIGADRLANAAAVAKLYGTPAVVVDFGTAVTFDVVSENSDYVGGVIAPGLESMTNFLYQRTALLPKLILREPRAAIGKTTRDAMMAGAIYGYRGLVREILRAICVEFPTRKKVRVVATGGYAQLIARRMPEIEAVHPGLTLEGLRIIANLNL
ncbi:MAG: type III pantothenate kinase [Verrucomicrobiota bacterium]|nr:type III pantothenate kinase [Verrucomicrobiota bacterium]